ncbi:MAG: pitrilysin family protein [Saprospiraceae bacterium]
MQIPDIKEIKNISYPEYNEILLDNGIPLIYIDSKDTEAFRIDIVFQAGRYFENHPVVAKVTSNLLKEGTTDMDSKKFAEFIDYHGASIATYAGMDTAYIQANFLGRYFNEIVDKLFDLTTIPLFSNTELDNFKTRQIEKLKNDLSKNDVLAFRHFTELIFGNDHPYGYSSTVENYKNVEVSMLKEHFYDYYTPDNCSIYITGDITNSKIDFLNQRFGKISQRKRKNIEIPFNNQNDNVGKFKYSNNRIHQTALRIGNKTISREHEDYPGFYILNTIFGGYFGARLSANIREDKGYTYGIYSTLDSLRHSGYFVIGADVGNEYLDKTLVEIYKELDILKNELVDKEELDLVKNYMKGNLLSMKNGNMLSMNLIKTLNYNNLGKNYFHRLVDKIENISAKEIQELAIKYFDTDSMTEVLVGNI